MDDKYSSNSPQNNTTTTYYAYSGKVMLISVITLFIFCILFAAFHFYSRFFIMRHSANLRRRHHLQRRRRHSFSAAAANSSGLSPSALKPLPTFLFSFPAGDDHPPLDCAVCLSEFSENETGRVLPKCNHAFHVECIDMWLVTHSSCPLCRAPIFQPNSGRRVDPVEVVAPVFEPGNTIGVSSSSSSPSLPQLPAVTVETPGVNEGSGIGPTRESGLKTTGESGPGPVRSLKRFLSI